MPSMLNRQRLGAKRIPTQAHFVISFINRSTLFS
jgi:hypothetical protein